MFAPREESYRYANRVSLSLLFWLAGFAALTAAGGVSYAALKNEQVMVRNEIEDINRAIAESTMNTNEHRAKINSMTSRWNMLGRLDSLGSELCDISSAQIEELRTLHDTDAGKATAAR